MKNAKIYVASIWFTFRKNPNSDIEEKEQKPGIRSIIRLVSG